MQAKITSIAQGFPDFDEIVREMLASDSAFRELCADYILCASKILDMKSEIGDCQTKLAEYEELQYHLEEEMAQRIALKKTRM